MVLLFGKLIINIKNAPISGVVLVYAHQQHEEWVTGMGNISAKKIMKLSRPANVIKQTCLYAHREYQS